MRSEQLPIRELDINAIFTFVGHPAIRYRVKSVTRTIVGTQKKKEKGDERVRVIYENINNNNLGYMDTIKTKKGYINEKMVYEYTQ